MKRAATTTIAWLFVLVASAAFTAPAFAALRVPQKPVLGGTLQAYFTSIGETINVLTDQDNTQLWYHTTSGTTTYTLQIENSPNANVNTISMVGWIVSDLIAGIVLVWLYAGIRPRFGPGPKTAANASLAVWFLLHVAYSSFAFLGIYSWSLMAASTAGGLVAAVLAGQAGCWAYREA